MVSLEPLRSQVSGWTGVLSAAGDSLAARLPRRVARIVNSSVAHGLLLVVVSLLLLVMWGPQSYEGYVLQLIAVYVVAVMGLNITTGYAGALSLGQGASFAIGAYLTGILAGTHGWPVWAVLPVALGAGLVAGMAIGLPAGRLGDIGLAMISLGLVLVVNDMLVQLRSVTGGNNGISGIDAHWTFGSTSLPSLWAVPILIVISAGVCFVVHSVYRTSRFGRATVAVRDESIGASALGISGYVTKVTAFAVGSAFGAFSGGLFAYLSNYISPDAFSPNLSILFLVMVVLGGSGSRLGPIVGVVLLVIIPLQLDQYPHVNVFVYGGLLIVLTRLRPRGLFTKSAASAPGVIDRLVTTPSKVAPERHIGGPVLEVVGLRRAFGGVDALGGVDLHVGRGEILGLVGPNGSGKTTMLNVVCGHYPPTAGVITLSGEVIGGLRPAVISSKGIARTFQTPKTFAGMSAEEHLALAAASAEADDELVAACSRAALRFLELGDLDPRDRQARTRESRTMSHGQLRFLEAATAVSTCPQLLLLDEPAAGLSAVEIDGFEQVVAELAAAGVAVILVEHHLDMIARLVDRVVVLDLGKVIWQGPPEELHSDATVRAAYMGLS